MPNSESKPKTIIRVWDIGTRLFHWLLVGLFGLSVYSAFQDKFGIYADMHLYSGFTILTLVVWRFVWGLVGSETSRFSQFVKSPKTILQYLRGEREQSVGHNPLGGWSVSVMLTLLTVQAGLGLFATDDMIFSGPLSGGISESLAADLTSLHKTMGLILFAFVGLHVAVILAYGLVRKVNLVWPMITGWAARDEKDATLQQPRMASPLLALMTFGVVAGALYFFILA